MLTNRAVSICLLEIFKEYSDDNHILQMNEIIKKLKNIYGFSPDRRTIYSSVELLKHLGYDISVYEENGIGYYLRERDFEQSEIILLCDAVYAFPFITEKQTNELANKLNKQLSLYKRKRFKHLRIIRSDKKAQNKQLFYNIEVLDKAIELGKQVSFCYLQYGYDKKMHPRRTEPYVVDVYGMVYMNEKYYLVCSLVSFAKTALYRIDRIKDIEILKSKNNNRENIKEEVERAIYAFAGTPEHITMRCKNTVLNDVIDKFGNDVRISDYNDEGFTVSLYVSPHGIKFWALQYLPYVEIQKPEWLRNDIIESIKINPYIEVTK